MLKKIIALLVSVSVLLSCTFITSSAVNASEDEIYSSDQLLEQAIYEQLAVQEKLDMFDVHLEIHKSLNLSQIIPYGDEDEYTNVHAPHGGVLQYEKWRPSPSTYVAVTYLDFDDSYYYVLSTQELDVSDVVLSILGYIPIVGTLAGMYSDAVAVITAGTAASIKDADGCTQIVTSTGEYQGESTTVSGWARYPYMYLNEDYVTDIRSTVFEEHNPFED